MFHQINDSKLQDTNGGLPFLIPLAMVAIIGGGGVATPVAIDQAARVERHKLEAEENQLNYNRQRLEEDVKREHNDLHAIYQERENYLDQAAAYMNFMNSIG